MPTISHIKTLTQISISEALTTFTTGPLATALALYQLRSEENQNNGYAGLDGTARVAAAQAPAKAVYIAGGAQGIVPTTDLNIRSFQSGELTGTGANVDTAHSLGAVPVLFGATLTEQPAGLAAGYDLIIAADATNVSWTTANTMKLLIWALRIG